MYKISKRSLYLCVINKFARRLRCEDLQKHCAAFALVTLFRVASFVVELILYTFGMGGVSVFLRIEFDIIT